MKRLIGRRVYRVCKNTTLFLLAAMLGQSTFAFDYPQKGDFAKGSKAWSENCARCHNMRSPTDLRDDQWVTTAFHMRVRAGLTGQETRDILTFLQATNTRVANTRVDQVEPASVGSDGISGKQIYESNCVACHGVMGKGNIPGVPDFTDKNGRLSKADSVLLSNIVNGLQSPGNVIPMPPRGGNSQLSDADLNAVLKYIKVSFRE